MHSSCRPRGTLRQSRRCGCGRSLVATSFAQSGAQRGVCPHLEPGLVGLHSGAKHDGECGALRGGHGRGRRGQPTCCRCVCACSSLKHVLVVPTAGFSVFCGGLACRSRFCASWSFSTRARCPTLWSPARLSRRWRWDEGSNRDAPCRAPCLRWRSTRYYVALPEAPVLCSGGSSSTWTASLLHCAECGRVPIFEEWGCVTGL